MRAFTNKKEFYNSIWADYLEHKDKVARGEYDKNMMKRCFIYRYFFEKRMAKSSVLAADREAFDRYLEDYLDNMETRRKNRGENAAEKSALKTIPRGDKFTLLSAARQVCGDDKERFGEILKAVTMSKNKNAKQIDPFTSFEEYTYMFICSAIQEFFRKKGYVQPKDSESGATTENVGRIPKNDDNYIDEIEMMHDYLRDLNADELSVAGGAQITDEYIQGCERLYRRLSGNDSKPNEIFLPLYIDPISGAGVYIIRTVDSETKEKISGVFVLTFWDCACDEGLEELNYEMKKFKSVGEAFYEFKKNLGGDEYCDGYTSYNAAIPDYVREGEIDERLLPLMLSAGDQETRRKKRDDEIKAEQKAKRAEEVRKYIKPDFPKPE